MELNALHHGFDTWYHTVDNAEALAIAYFRGAISARKRRVFVALSATDEVVGFVHFIVEPRPPIYAQQRVVRILDICVAEKWRYAKQGPDVGTSLIRRLVGSVQRRTRVRIVVAHVAYRNRDALDSFWRKAGFNPVSICMVKTLPESDT